MLAAHLAGLLLLGPVDDGFQWQAPGECPTAVDVRERVASLTDRPWEAERLQVNARIDDASDGSWTLHLRMETAGGASQSRTLVSDDCTELADAVALIVAVALGEEGMSGEGETAAVDGTDTVGVADDQRGSEDDVASEANSERDSRSLPSTTEPEEVYSTGITLIRGERVREPRQRGSVEALLGLDGGVDLGAVGAVTGGGRLSVGVGWRLVRVELVGGFWAPRTHQLLAGVGARSSLGSIELRGCGRPRAGKPNRGGGTGFEFPLCLGVEGGVLRSKGFGFVTSRIMSSPWLAITATPKVVWWLHQRVGLSAGLQIWLALVRPRVIASTLDEPSNTLFRVSPAGGRVSLGLEVRI